MKVINKKSFNNLIFENTPSLNRLIIYTARYGIMANMYQPQENKFCFDNGIVLKKLNEKRKSLETRFLEITGTKSEK